MDYDIEEIVLGDQFERYTTAPAGSSGNKVLSDLSKINIFVGGNNSGKSRFLRSLSCNPQLSFTPHLKLPPQWTWQMISGVIEQFRKNLTDHLNSNRIKEIDFLEPLNSVTDLRFLGEGAAPVSLVMKVAESILDRTDFGRVTYSGGSRPDATAVLGPIKEFARTLLENLGAATVLQKPPEYKFSKLYIPTLRGLRCVAGARKDIYAERTATDYFAENKVRPEIFTGLTLYDEVERLLRGDLKARSRIQKFEAFLSKSFFDSQPVALIPKLGSDVIDIKIGDETERPIHHLGDGVQSIIILTFPLFMHEGERLLVFVEEPELYLHPGLQRVLLTTLQRFKTQQYFFTTHSNHFLDLTLDFSGVSVFTFEKRLDDGDGDERHARFTIENLSNDSSRPLQLLGVRNSSVLLSNCTIWVEGITDRRYFRKFLDIYQKTQEKQFKEDLHFSFVEYGGANITHFSFLDATPDAIVVERLCSRLFLITDHDNAKGVKAVRQEELRKKLGDRYYCLRCKEVENLLRPETIKATVRKYEGDAEFNDFDFKDYQSKSLGDFIDTTVLKGKRKRKASYAKDSTLRDKPDFCEKAVAEINSVSDLSPEALEIAKRLYEFIAANN